MTEPAPERERPRGWSRNDYCCFDGDTCHMDDRSRQACRGAHKQCHTPTPAPKVQTAEVQALIARLRRFDDGAYEDSIATLESLALKVSELERELAEAKAVFKAVADCRAGCDICRARAREVLAAHSAEQAGQEGK